MKRSIIRKGDPIKVVNQEKLQGRGSKNNREDDEYYSFFLEGEDGKDEVTVLFTDSEINKLKLISLPEVVSKILIKGRRYPFGVGKARDGYMVKIGSVSGIERVIQLSDRLYKKALKRANKHPLSAPKKGLLEDILD